MTIQPDKISRIRRVEQADLVISGYANLRPGRDRWRGALRRLAGPVLRLHSLRDTRTRLWREALRGPDRHAC